MKLYLSGVNKYQHVLIDEDDYYTYSEYRWYDNGVGYPRRNVQIDGKRKYLYLHRLVIGAKTGDIVDHINGNTYDCRKGNLRLVTKAFNGNHRVGKITAGSGVRGVYLSHNHKHKWVARITVDGIDKHIGYFDDLTDASIARKKAELEIGL